MTTLDTSEQELKAEQELVEFLARWKWPNLPQSYFDHWLRLWGGEPVEKWCTRSLDACGLLMDKLREMGYLYRVGSEPFGGHVAVIKLMKTYNNFYREYHKDLAMAFCLALKELILTKNFDRGYEDPAHALFWACDKVREAEEV